MRISDWSSDVCTADLGSSAALDCRQSVSHAEAISVMPVIGDIAQSRKAIADAGKHAVNPVGRYAAGGITVANLCAREDGNKFVDEREGCVRGDRAVDRTIEHGRNMEPPRDPLRITPPATCIYHDATFRFSKD